MKPARACPESKTTLTAALPRSIVLRSHYLSQLPPPSRRIHFPALQPQNPSHPHNTRLADTLLSRSSSPTLAIQYP